MGEFINLIARDDFQLSAYVATPEKPKASIVIIEEIFGVNASIQDACEEFAAEGFYTIAPAIFDRQKARVDLGYGKEDFTKGLALMRNLDRDKVMLDIQAAINQGSMHGKVAVLGFCLGGSLAWQTAINCRVAAAVCYYGGEIYQHRAQAPQCPVLMHFGDQDEYITKDKVAEIRAHQPEVEIFTYPADHAFANHKRKEFHADSAALAKQRTLTFLKKYL